MIGLEDPLEDPARAASRIRAEDPLAWLNDFVGVPYLVNGRTRAGWDCWGLVLAVYRERLGLELPDWLRPAPFGLVAQMRAFAEGWEFIEANGHGLELPGPRHLAIVLVRRSRLPHHVGVQIGGGILHAEAAYAGTVYEPLARFRANHPAASWWQWQD